MRIWQVALLVGYSTGMAVGQLLFKQAAITLRVPGKTYVQLLVAVGTNVPLLAALTLYGGLTALWVYILTIMELSKAYPFVALAFVLTPMMANFVFNEPLAPSYFVGLTAIVAGLLIITWGSHTP
jgi:multidrug transporter EmrE-like cation transporter